MKTVLIIQARMNSTRLPGKVMMKVLDKPILEWMIERMSLSKIIDEIVIATTPTSQEIIKRFHQYKSIAWENKKLSLFVGPEDDVLRRTCMAAANAKADTVVDVTSDCPLCDPDHIDQVINDIYYQAFSEWPQANRFYRCNIEPRLWPDGFDFQVYSPQLLYEIECNLHKDDKLREHSGWNILQSYKFGNKIDFNNLSPASPWHCAPKMRLTLDYKEDFDTLSLIIKHFAQKNKIIDQSAEEIIDYVVDNPNVLQNRHLEDRTPPVLDIYQLQQFKSYKCKISRIVKENNIE